MKTFFVWGRFKFKNLIMGLLGVLFFEEPGSSVNLGFPIGRMVMPRVGHTLTLIDDHRVFMAGGGYSELGSVPSIEIFNLLKQRVEKSANGMEARSGHTATKLRNGQIALVGGSADYETSLDSVEIVDSETLEVVQTLKLNVPRSGHGAFLSANGRLVIVGGFDGRGYLDSVEILEPGAEKFLLLNNILKKKRGSFESTLVKDKFVVTGGFTINEAGEDSLLADGEVLDATDLKSDGLIPLIGPRAYHAAVSFEGELYLLGGISDFQKQVSSIEKVDLKHKQSFEIGSLNIPRSLHSASVTKNGFVAHGGTSFREALGDAEVCRLEKKTDLVTLRSDGSLVVCERFPKAIKIPRWSHRSTSLENGDIFVLGGISFLPDPGSKNGGPTNSVEKLDLP